MKSSAFVMGLLSFLLGCAPKKDPYHKEEGHWYFEKTQLDLPDRESLTPLGKTFARAGNRIFYRAQRIDSADAESFRVLSEHYAKDKSQAYWCDTYRRGQDYYLVKYNRVHALPNADPLSFEVLKDDYARDARRVYSEGNELTGADAPSFEVLEAPYARDARRGYYQQEPVDGSDGKSFSVINDHFAKDSLHVFYSERASAAQRTGRVTRSTLIKGAQPSSFTALEYGYAYDAGHFYFNDKTIGVASSPLTVLSSSGYAKSATQVFFMGQLVKGADAPSFEVVSDSTYSALDAHFFYENERRLKPR